MIWSLLWRHQTSSILGFVKFWNIIPVEYAHKKHFFPFPDNCFITDEEIFSTLGAFFWIDDFICFICEFKWCELIEFHIWYVFYGWILVCILCDPSIISGQQIILLFLCLFVSIVHYCISMGYFFNWTFIRSGGFL